MGFHHSRLASPSRLIPVVRIRYQDVIRRTFGRADVRTVDNAYPGLGRPELSGQADAVSLAHETGLELCRATGLKAILRPD